MTNTNAPVTVIGLGPMGTALAATLLDAGHPVTLWNRTRAKAAGLEARGAAWAPGPADAVAASPLTLVNVVDHDVLDKILSEAAPALRDRDVVGLTSDIPDRARGTAGLVRDAGGSYLDGAIMTPTATIGTGDASILLAGPRELADRHRELLEVLGRTTWVGADVGRAAAFDVALLDLFWSSVAGFLHALSLAAAEGVTPDEFAEPALGILAILPPIASELGRRVASGDHAEPSSTIDSTLTSVGHLVAASEARGLDTAALRALRDLLAAASRRGTGDAAISAVLSTG